MNDRPSDQSAPEVESQPATQNGLAETKAAQPERPTDEWASWQPKGSAHAGPPATMSPEPERPALGEWASWQPKGSAHAGPPATIEPQPEPEQPRL